MKVKLLKKTRKRFAITHHPMGITQYNHRYHFNLFRLTDNYNEYFDCFTQLGRKETEIQFSSDDKIFETEGECINYLKSVIINILRYKGYRGKKDKIFKDKSKKVWYV
jgi:hypothetical protein